MKRKQKVILIISNLSFLYYLTFFWGEAVKVEDEGVDFLVGLGDDYNYNK